MSQFPLSLGPITFQEFKIPSAITFGGRQRTAVHFLADGRRLIDPLGPDDSRIEFSGVLSGPSAAPRAREIDMLRSYGRSLLLTWSHFEYQVIIQNFTAQYRNQTWIPYRIGCLALSNPYNDNSVFDDNAMATVAASVNLIYDQVPGAYQPSTNLRAMLPLIGPSPSIIGDVAPTLLDTNNTINHLRKRQDNPRPIAPRSPLDFDTMVANARDMQILALAIDCLGHVIVNLQSTIRG